HGIVALYTSSELFRRILHGLGFVRDCRQCRRLVDTVRAAADHLPATENFRRGDAGKRHWRASTRLSRVRKHHLCLFPGVAASVIMTPSGTPAHVRDDVAAHNASSPHRSHPAPWDFPIHL